MNLTYRDDVVYLIKTMIDDETEAIEVKPTLDKDDAGDYETQLENNIKLDLFIKCEVKLIERSYK